MKSFSITALFKGILNYSLKRCQIINIYIYKKENNYTNTHTYTLVDYIFRFSDFYESIAKMVIIR